MYAIMAMLQAGTVHEPGWGAVLDPIFFFFAAVLLFSIGVVLRLALRSDDAAPVDWGEDE